MKCEIPRIKKTENQKGEIAAVAVIKPNFEAVFLFTFKIRSVQECHKMTLEF